MSTFGYSKEQDGESVIITLRMTEKDYGLLLLALGISTGYSWKQDQNGFATAILQLVNKLNVGNPDFAPYAT